METKERKVRFPLNIQFFGEKEDDIDPNEVEEEPVEEEKEDEPEQEPEKEKRKQSQSENAKFAQRRREAEAKAKAEKQQTQDSDLEKAKQESYRKGLRDGIKTNPYTEEPIEDDYDLELYEIQKALDEQGKDPTKDLPRELARLRREKAEEERKRKEDEDARKSKEEAEREESIAKKKREIAEVRKQYDLTQKQMEELLTDPESEIYKQVSSKGGRWTLMEIFETYYKKPAEQEKRSTVNLTPGGTKAEHKPFSEMTDDEYEAYAIEKHGGF